MKKIIYLYILILFLILFLFYLYNKKILYYKIENFNNCNVSDGDKKIGLDQYYDQTCISKGGLGCLGKLGCRLCCQSCQSNNPYYSVKCPSTITCTPENQDPNNTCPSGQYLNCCDGLSLTYTTSGLRCVNSTNPPIDKCINISCPSGSVCDTNTGSCSTPVPPIDKCINISCPSGSVCDTNTGSCSTPVPPIDKCINDSSKISNTCNDHVSWVKSHISDYNVNGLNTGSDSALIQQYLYACENDICPCNSNYGGEDKNTSISKYNWKCNTKPNPPNLSNYKMNYNSTEIDGMIKVLKPASKNYIIVIGDWGAPAYNNMIPKQKLVSELMKTYVNKNTDNGMNLLFIATTGDNFYDKGLKNEDNLKSQWFDIYNGSIKPDKFGRKSLTDYPWFPVLGNHDIGNDDMYTLCPDSKPNKKIIGGQSYGSNQFNPDKGGLSRNTTSKNYYMPDFSYHVEIPDLKFELIVMEVNYIDSGGLGGNGIGGGASEVGRLCGGQSGINKKLKIIGDASIDVLNSRADKNNKNFLLTNHYNGAPWQTWSDILTKKDPDRQIKIIGGHVHNYHCESLDNDGSCKYVISGNGGGWGGDGNKWGFYVYGFKDGDVPILYNIGVQQTQME